MMQWTLQGSNEELKNVICLVWLQLISLVISEHGHFLKILFRIHQSVTSLLCFGLLARHGTHSSGFLQGIFVTF